MADSRLDEGWLAWLGLACVSFVQFSHLGKVAHEGGVQPHWSFVAPGKQSNEDPLHRINW